MNYEVIWTPNALTGLATIWMRASNKQSVNWAQAKIDQLLASDPKHNGLPLMEGLYALNLKPLRAVYAVSAAPARVIVESVNEIR